MEILISVSSSLKLVPFTEDLVESFVEFRRTMHKESKYVNDITIDAATTLQKDWSTSPKHGLLLLDGTAVIGQLFWTVRKVVHLNLISVLSKYHGAQASTMLIEKIKSVGKKLDKSVELIVANDNMRAQKFYEKNGFKKVGPYAKRNTLYSYHPEG